MTKLEEFLIARYKLFLTVFMLSLAWLYWGYDKASLIVNGFYVSVVVGAVYLYLFHEIFWGLIKKDLRTRPEYYKSQASGDDSKNGCSILLPTQIAKHIKIWLGVIDRVLYTVALITGNGQWIPFWLGFKLAVSWKSMSQTGKVGSHNIFLFLNGLSLLFAVIGAWIASGYTLGIFRP